MIPALNEEESIGGTIQRCLDAREHIRHVGRVRDIQIVVVSDGSTDRTAEIARSFADRDSAVRVIVFEQNRGYGAAIKEGFARSSGELVAFLDADGTCDPTVFADLCRPCSKKTPPWRSARAWDLIRRCHVFEGLAITYTRCCSDHSVARR